MFIFTADIELAQKRRRLTELARRLLEQTGQKEQEKGTGVVLWQSVDSGCPRVPHRTSQANLKQKRTATERDG